MNRKAKALEFANADYNFQITGRHIEITDAMKDYALEKISKLEKFLNRLIDVVVIMDIQKLDQQVEIILKAGNIKIRSSAASHDMYASIDKAVDKLEAQILRYKSKIQDHHAKGHAEMNMEVNVFKAPSENETEFDEYQNEEKTPSIPQILKKKTLPLKILTQSEAMMKMELSGDAFLIYKSEEDQKLKVIYRRRDGSYGIVEPQNA